MCTHVSLASCALCCGHRQKHVLLAPRHRLGGRGWVLILHPCPGPGTVLPGQAVVWQRQLTCQGASTLAHGPHMHRYALTCVVRVVCAVLCAVGTGSLYAVATAAEAFAHTGWGVTPAGMQPPHTHVHTGPFSVPFCAVCLEPDLATRTDPLLFHYSYWCGTCPWCSSSSSKGR